MHEISAGFNSDRILSKCFLLKCETKSEQIENEPKTVSLRFGLGKWSNS